MTLRYLVDTNVLSEHTKRFPNPAIWERGRCSGPRGLADYYVYEAAGDVDEPGDVFAFDVRLHSWA